MSFDVEIDEYDGIDIEAITNEELFKTALEAKNTYQVNVQHGRGAEGSHDGPYIDRGEAVNSIMVSPGSEGRDAYVVGGDEIQLLIAEVGRAPNNSLPPEKPISEWALRNGLQPADDQTWESMVFAIRESIAENGIEPFRPAERTAQELRGTYEERVTRRLNEALGDIAIRD